MTSYFLGDSGQFPSTTVFNEDEPFQFISPANFVSVGDPDVTGALRETVLSSRRNKWHNSNL